MSAIRELLIAATASVCTAFAACAQQPMRDSLRPPRDAPTRLDSAVTWLASHAVRLKTVELGRGFDDMEPIRAIVGNARVVALGEASHGTHEVFQFKARLVEFLVTQMGFTVLAREQEMPAAFDINDYVLTGRGDPSKALAATRGWPGNTEEHLDNIRWMRTYNADPNHSRKVKYYGIDQTGVTRSLRTALDYLHSVDPEEARAFAKPLEVLADQFLADNVTGLPEAQTDSLLPTAKRLLARFDEQHDSFVRRTSQESWGFARQHARLLVQWLEVRHYLSLRPPNPYKMRDQFMAENVLWILDREGPNAKMIVSAHNGHVLCDHPAYGEAMGCHLRRKLGRDLVVFGSVLGHGGVHAVDTTAPPHSAIGTFELPSLPDSSFSGAFRRAGLSTAVVDLRAIPSSGPVAEWFALPHQAWMLGAPFFGQKNITKRVFTQAFDAVFFVDSTSPSHLGPGVRQRDQPVLAAPANLTFEVRDPDGRPQDWSADVLSTELGYVVSASDDRPYSGKLSGLIARGEGRHYGEGSGVIRQMIDATPYRGKWVRLRAKIRADVKSEVAHVHFWLLPATPTLNERTVTTNAWRPFELVVHIPERETYIEYGLTLVGDGRAYIDDVTFEVIPPPRE